MMLKKEKASEEAQRIHYKPDKVKYEVRDNDIILLSGKYSNCYVRDLFSRGPIERDYIMDKLWMKGDEAVCAIINSMTCK